MYSRVTRLLECLFDWAKAYDEEKGVDAIYLDFRKAFVTVPHARLLYKLHHFGIRGHALDWIVGFLVTEDREPSSGMERQAGKTLQAEYHRAQYYGRSSFFCLLTIFLT